MSIEQQAIEILKDFSICENMPASLSNKHHFGETSKQHLEIAVNVMKHLCDEFNVPANDRDMLIAATWLHDIGLYVITKMGYTEEIGWKNFPTAYCRLEAAMTSHGCIGASLLEKYNIERKKEIQKLVACHMSHWYPYQPQPNCLYEYLICLADYVASRGEGILKYEK